MLRNTLKMRLETRQLLITITSIVAVHGLGGDSRQTWTNRKNGIFWLKDCLPHDFNHARIMTFGYNAAAAFGRSTASIIDHAKDLLSSLADKREHDKVTSLFRFIYGTCLG